jgi:hypothetical protein
MESKTSYAVVIGLMLSAGFFAAYGMRRHHAEAQPSQVVDRTLKGDVVVPDPHTFDGRLAITPGMFQPQDCNPAVVCPWGGRQRLPWWMQ